MPETLSRHDHFPRGDPARRLAMHAAVAELAAAWAAADTAPGGLFAAIDALADAPADTAIAALLPWLTDACWHAMRELIALDPAAARAPFAQMAAHDPHPEVRRAAAATLAMFNKPYPSGEGQRDLPACWLVAAGWASKATPPRHPHPQPLPQAGGEQKAHPCPAP